MRWASLRAQEGLIDPRRDRARFGVLTRLALRAALSRCAGEGIVTSIYQWPGVASVISFTLPFVATKKNKGEGGRVSCDRVRAATVGLSYTNAGDTDLKD